jgi:nicotinate-nucleotide adenylyltransferase
MNMSADETKPRLGLLGGTFNPIHLGHVQAARIVKERCRLDRVLFIPSFIPPHKEGQDVASAQHRFSMVQLAIKGEPGFEASTLEIDSPGTSYSIDTLDRVSQSQPEAEVFFILGIDAFLEIATWKDYEKVLDRCSFIVISRPGYLLEEARSVLDGRLQGRMKDLGISGEWGDSLSPEAGPTIYLLEIDALDIASSEIRRRLFSGASIADMAPESVREYIKEHRLYMTKQENLPPEIQLCVEAAADKKAEDILVIDLQGISSFTDYFVIVHGNSNRQNRAIYESVELELKKTDTRPLSVEGKQHAEWILMDYGHFIVHVFSPTARAYYGLEKLWGDGIKHTF